MAKDWTAPRIVESSGYWYVEFTWFDSTGEHRERIYTGREHGLPGSGNRLKGLRQRRAYFAELAAAISEQLAAGWRPGREKAKIVKDGPMTVGRASELSRARRVWLGKSAKQNFARVLKRFEAHFGSDTAFDQVTTPQIQQFLTDTCPGRQNWNNYRRDLSVWFNDMIEAGAFHGENPVSKIRKMKVYAVRNEAYTLQELRALLSVLKPLNERLWLLCNVMFYAFLRPNEEARLLQGKHLDFSAGTATTPRTKNGDIVTRSMHPSLRAALLEFGADRLGPDEYLFSENGAMLNDHYFRTAWQRLRPVLPLRPGQSLYSVRHSAACLLYQKTKDPERVRDAMGHKDLKTTLTYLRSLGLFTSRIAADDLPEL